MDDRELKKLLMETCPVRPGQEDRAWKALREQLYGKAQLSWWHSLVQPTWRSGALAGLGFGLVVGAICSFVLTSQERTLATADSQAPGIYATSFYSKSAQAQVVWLNGLEPASDKPTFLEKTGQVRNPPEDSPTADPNRL
jgi:hypothetical protein